MTRASAGLHRRGWEVETTLFCECKRLVVMEAVSLVCQLFGALVLAVNAAPYFWEQWWREMNKEE